MKKRAFLYLIILLNILIFSAYSVSSISVKIVFSYDSSGKGIYSVYEDNEKINNPEQKYGAILLPKPEDSFPTFFYWTAPSKIQENKINVQVWGGGGGGGVSYKYPEYTGNNLPSAGSGGGAGGYASAALSIVPSARYALNIGKGGEGGFYDSSTISKIKPGSQGGRSTFDWDTLYNDGTYYSNVHFNKPSDHQKTTAGGGGGGLSRAQFKEDGLNFDYAYIGYKKPPAVSSTIDQDGNGYGDFPSFVENWVLSVPLSDYTYISVGNGESIESSGGRGGVGMFGDYLVKGKNGDSAIDGVTQNSLGGQAIILNGFSAGKGGDGTYNSNGKPGSSGMIILSFELEEQNPPQISQCSNENQIIFRTYNEEDSKISSWDDSSAQIELCYDNIFGTTYEGTNPRECKDSNIILKKYSERESLVSSSSANGLLDVCYGDLICSTIDSTQSCPSGYLFISALSENENAKVSLIENLFTSSESLKICCRSPSSNPPEEGESFSLEHQQIYFKDQNIVFDSSIFSDLNSQADKVSWSIEENWWPSESDKKISTFDTKYQVRKISTPGQKIIKVSYFKDNKIIEEKEISILVIDNTNQMFTYVNNPSHNELLDFSAEDSGNFQVSLNSEQSYSLYVSKTNPSQDSGCDYVIKCLSGICPSQTKGKPKNCENLIEIRENKKDYANTDFTWFLQKNDGSWGEFLSGKNLPSVVFPFTTIGTKRIAILQEFNNLFNQEQINLDNKFFREFTLTVQGCSYSGTEYYDSSGNKFSTLSNGQACLGRDSQQGTSDDCCPSGNECRPSLDTSGNQIPGMYSCQVSDYLSCSDYKTESLCLEDPAKVGATSLRQQDSTQNPVPAQLQCGEQETTLKNGQLCTERVLCSCTWQNNECGLNVLNSPQCKSINGGGGGDVEPPTSCSFAYDLSECSEDGYKTIAFRDLSNNPECSKDPIQIACPKVALPFISQYFILLSSLLIIIIYILINKKSLIKMNTKM